MKTLDPVLASRLCSSCGMCCNGVLFFGAVLQPGDDPRALAAMGLRVKKHGGSLNLLQPCPAHQHGTCTVYEERPARCRIFVCRQLKELSEGNTTEKQVMTKIGEATDLVARVRQLFEAAGDTRDHKAFVTRYASIFNEPLDPSPEAAEIRAELHKTMKDLEDLLARDFRME